jgi:hypothetical protein
MRHGRIRNALGTVTLLASVGATLVACGGETPEPKTPVRESEATPHAEHPSLTTSADIGALDEARVSQAFHSAQKDLQACLAEGAKRNELEGGDIAFLVKIGASGRVVHAHAEKSTLGDRDTEKCMLHALGKREWPPPEGGDVGIARNSFGFDMPNDERPPTDWGPDRADEAKASVAKKLAECKHGGGMTATVYVDPDGAATSVGVAASDDSGEGAADCVVAALKEAKFPSPGSWPAKVTFDL